jgi:hypothetical protein
MSYPNNANYYLPGVVTIPSALQITSISQSSPMIMDTTYDPVTSSNTYIPGMVVKLVVPKSYGMFQANGLFGKILNVIGSIFTLALDSSNFDPFVVPGATAEQPASIVPSGSNNTQYDNTTVYNLPFKSLNNIGN